jgi:SAM-dependent methyltransferase
MGLANRLKRSRNFLLAYAAARATFRRGQQLLTGREPLHTGMTTRNWTVERSADYIRHQLADYQQYGGLGPEQIAGRSVLEIGPGDNLGVGLMMIAQGARQYTALDKHKTHRDPAKEREIYQSLRAQLDEAARARFDAALDLSGDGIAWKEDRIRAVYGTPAERADEVLSGPFDIIISRAVLQEIPAGEKLFAALNKLLAPGGYSVHKLDLSDYLLFSANGHHPLEFLTVPEPIYGLLNRPSRRHLDFYRRQMERFGYRYRIFIASLIGISPGAGDHELLPHVERLEANRHYEPAHIARLQAIRPRLAAPFRSLPDEDLLVRTFFLSATKPL